MISYVKHHLATVNDLLISTFFSPPAFLPIMSHYSFQNKELQNLRKVTNYQKFFIFYKTITTACSHVFTTRDFKMLLAWRGWNNLQLTILYFLAKTSVHVIYTYFTYVGKLVLRYSCELK